MIIVYSNLVSLDVQQKYFGDAVEGILISIGEINKYYISFLKLHSNNDLYGYVSALTLRFKSVCISFDVAL
ncbi:unnamed protein product [Rhizophagus irregularis]|nr:unnamed protein product [Rhizophagus irregularis]